MAKIRYKILIYILVIELVILKIMQEFGIKFDTGLPSAIAIVCFFGPLQLIFYKLSKEEKQPEICKTLFGFFFWGFNVAIVGGIIIGFSK